MQHRFNTFIDALAAGYAAHRGLIERYKNFEVRAIDVSGPHSFGYSYAIGLVAGPCDMEGHDRFTLHGCPTFGRSVMVSLTEARNAGGGIGSLSPMFHPQVLRDGVASARAWVDAYYGATPEAAQSLARLEREHIVIRERQDAKQAARAATRLANRSRRELAATA